MPDSELSLVAMLERLRLDKSDARKLDPVDLLEQTLEQAREHVGAGNKTNAFITLDEKGARKKAEASRKRLQAGGAGAIRDSIRVLEGIPLAYKDMFCTQGVRTTAGSKMLDNFIPPYSAHVVELLEEEAGAIGIGKCNQDEFAMGSYSNSGYQGAVVNPLRDKRKPDEPLSAGGSSGGSAAAVAARIVPAALGTDTGGSVRQPAAFTGCVGVKPTYGLCSRFGIIAYASSLDQAGVFARSVEDAKVTLYQMFGRDERDMTSVVYIDEPAKKLEKSDKVKLKARLGLIKPGAEHEKNFPHLAAWQSQLDGMLAGLGGELAGLSTLAVAASGEGKDSMLLDPHSGSLEAYYIISMAEASSNLARYDGVRYGHRASKASLSSSPSPSLHEMISASRSQGFGAEVQRRIIMGTHVLSAGYYEDIYRKAQRVRRLICESYQKLFSLFDILISPVSPDNHATALKTNEAHNPMQYFQDFYTVPPSLAGLPCLSLPMGIDKASGLPFALQLIGNYFQEDYLLAVAHHLERHFKTKQ